MKTNRSFAALITSALLLLAPAAGFAQTVAGTIIDPTRQRGDREFTLGANGASNTDFNDSYGGVNLAFGSYISPTQLLVLRQSINYANPSGGSQAWGGATRLAFDQHFAARGALRPFVGVNIGGVYGDAVRDTWAAGLEAGAKFYVQPRTFVFLMAEYGWFFRKAHDVEDTFRDGQLNWSAGIGFNF